MICSLKFNNLRGHRIVYIEVRAGQMTVPLTLGLVRRKSLKLVGTMGDEVLSNSTVAGVKFLDGEARKTLDCPFESD